METDFYTKEQEECEYVELHCAMAVDELDALAPRYEELLRMVEELER